MASSHYQWVVIMMMVMMMTVTMMVAMMRVHTSQPPGQ
jgi:hypothetical protein